MTWCNESEDHERGIHQIRDVTPTPLITPPSPKSSQDQNGIVTCPSCGHTLEFQDQGGIHELPGLPAGVKFDPNDQEILEHLEGKVVCDVRKLHPLIDQFIPTLEGENGICYTHPEKLPGVSKDGQIRHFFHRPSKAYTTGTRKRRKVQTEEEGSETRWHKTGKTRAVFVNGEVKGFKKILVLYTNYGRKRKPEKTSWVMHQYHLGGNEEEREGELVVSKVFFQTQPRQCANNNNNTTTNNSSSSNIIQRQGHGFTTILPNKNIASASSSGVLEYYNNSPPTNYIDNNYDDDQHHHNNNNNNVMMMMMGHSHSHHHNSTSVRETSPQLIPNLVLQGDAASSFFSFANACKQSKTF